MTTHPVSATFRGEVCALCGDPATHKVGEEIPHDDYRLVDGQQFFHELTNWLCCEHFRAVMGRSVSCGKGAAFV